MLLAYPVTFNTLPLWNPSESSSLAYPRSVGRLGQDADSDIVIAEVLQYRTTKRDKFDSTRNRFFWGNRRPGLFSGRPKTSKTGLAGLFPRFLRVEPQPEMRVII